MSAGARIAGFLLFACAAAVAAYTVGYIAHHDLGFPRQAIRTQALLLAAVLSGLLAITLFGSGFGKRK